ncbi:MAG: aspartate aminotransferase family protein [Flavobacteriales bacterium]|nr:aspartate aminotransferase family protein [Flavobacteriales bacterium]
MNEVNFFLEHLGQTNENPFLISVERAEGSYIYDKNGKPYLDMISGVAVNNVGHRHPKIISAIQKQLDKHLHVMVYGEFIQDAQLNLANALKEVLPLELSCVYAVNSGTEANEAAIKLAKRYTGRTEIVSFRGSYHGSTNGSLSISGNETKKMAYRPLLPDVRFLHWNDETELVKITEKSAGVIIETIQGDAGVRIPIIFDEIQCGMGRTGKLFAFEHYDIIPDVLTLGKALGGGMPIGALVSSHEILQVFTNNPMLGHITTFGGHPLVAAAASAAVNVLSHDINYTEVERLGKKLESSICSLPGIKASRRIGYMFAFDMESAEQVEKVVTNCLANGVITFWFLSHPYSFRLSPPLTISELEIDQAINVISQAIIEAI